MLHCEFNAHRYTNLTKWYSEVMEYRKGACGERESDAGYALGLGGPCPMFFVLEIPRVFAPRFERKKKKKKERETTLLAQHSLTPRPTSTKLDIHVCVYKINYICPNSWQASP
jgi:hypothetical protein